MTISKLEYQASFIGNGATTEFPYVVNYYETDSIEVYFNDVKQTLGYEVTKKPQLVDEDISETVNIKFTTAPPVGINILIIRKTPKLQVLDFVDGSKLRAITLERGFDYVIMMIQELVQGAKGETGDIGPIGEAGVDWYNPIKNYKIHEICVHNQFIYRSLSDGNIAKLPPDTPTFWFKVREIEANSVGTSDLKNKAVTLDKMADGTPYKYMGYNGSNVPSEMPTPLGVNQVWTSFTIGEGAERDANTEYTNNTGQSIEVNITGASIGHNFLELYIDGKMVGKMNPQTSAYVYNISAIVGNNLKYELKKTAGEPVNDYVIANWKELR